MERGDDAEFHDLLDCAEGICPAQSEDIEVLAILGDIFCTRGADAAQTNKKEVALTNNSQFLRIRKKISAITGKRDAKLAHAYNQAANAHMDQGRVSDAVGLYSTGLEILKSHKDYDPETATMAIANLGTAYWLLGDYDVASSVLYEDLNHREKLYGRDDTTSFRYVAMPWLCNSLSLTALRTGRILHVLGNVQSSRGDLNDSFSFYQQALAVYRATVGEEHHRTADMCYKVAEACLRMDDISSALLVKPSLTSFCLFTDPPPDPFWGKRWRYIT